MNTIDTIKNVSNELEKFKNSYDWNSTIAYLDNQDIDYSTESGRSTKWTDLEIYKYYLENKDAIDIFGVD